MKAIALIAILWPSPGQYVPRCVFVTVENAAARAFMHAHGERFPNQRTAAGTLLTCVLWINQYHFAAGAFSLAAKDADELAPASISDTTGQSAVPEHVCHTQAFRSTLQVYQIARKRAK